MSVLLDPRTLFLILITPLLVGGGIMIWIALQQMKRSQELVRDLQALLDKDNQDI